MEEIYNQAVKISHNIVEDIRFGRELYLSPVKACSIHICQNLDSETEVLTFLNSVQDKEPYMFFHPVHVAFLSMVIGKWMNLGYTDLLDLVQAGLLHDIGKAKIRDSLLNKDEALTFEEIEQIKAHPVVGYKILKGVGEFDLEVLKGVLFHHERMDGSGYPLGLAGNKINLFSRIIAIADTLS